jgi:hypothetical protein
MIMKKLMPVFFLILIAVVGAGVFLYQRQATVKELAIAEVLPGGALFHIRLDRIEENVERLSQTRLWKSLMAIDYEGILPRAGLGQEDVELFKSFKSQFPSSEALGHFFRFFGREISVSFYSGNLENIDPNNLTPLLANLYFTTRIKPEVKFADLLSSHFAKMGKEITLEKSEYKNRTINIVTVSGGLKIVYGVFKDLLILGLDERVVKTCVDVMDQKAPSLKLDPQYQKVAGSFLDPSHLDGYVNLELLTSIIRQQAAKYMLSQQQAAGEEAVKAVEDYLNLSFGQMRGFKALVYSAVFNPLSEMKMDIYFDTTQMDPLVRPFYECQPVKNRTLEFTPQDVMIYSWQSCFDFDVYWKQFKAEMEKRGAVSGERSGSLDEMVSGIEQSINLSFEYDILPALGKEVGGFLSDIDVQGVFPIPEFLFFVEVGDYAKATQVIQTLIGLQPIFRPETEQYQDVTISYITVPMITNLQPAYTILGDYLLLTSNRPLLKEAVDVFSNTSQPLAKNSQFQEFQLGSSQNNAAGFLQSDKFIDKLLLLIDWGYQWVAMQAQRQDAFRAGSEQRLQDVRKEIAQQEKSLESAKAELASEKAAMQDMVSGDTTRGAGLEKSINRIESELVSLREKEEELSTLLKNFSAGDFDPKAREVFFNELLKPAVRALGSVKALGAKTVIGNNIMESYLYWKVE